jgi:membrane protein
VAAVATGTSVIDSVKRVREGARALSARELVEGVIESFREHDLLVQAGGMAFRVLLALIPATCFVIGLLGVFGFDEVWSSDIAPDLRDSVSTPAFKLIDDAVTHVLTQQQAFWVTIGAGIAVWEISGVVRASEKVLNRIYRAGREDRSVVERFGVSFAVAAAVGASMLAALAVVRLGPYLIDDNLGSVLGFFIRWITALALLMFAVGLVVRAAPAVKRPLHWVSFGALVSVGAWAVMSLAFGLYLTQVADYASIFGNLATVFVLLEYLFLAAIAFLAGLVVDSLVQKKAS